MIRTDSPDTTTADADFDGRIGEKMTRAVQLVADNGPYRATLPLAVKVGPNGSTDYGYRTVKRCLQRDLLTRDPDHDAASPNSAGAVVLTDRGRAYLDAEVTADE